MYLHHLKEIYKIKQKNHQNLLKTDERPTKPLYPVYSGIQRFL